MSVYFEGRFLDGQLTLLLSELADPGPGYAVNPLTGRIWRNGEYVADVLKLSYDRNALGWWVDYQSWHGSPLDHPAVVACPRCEDSGEIQVGGSSLNPRVGVRGPDPQCDDVVRCPECQGR